MKDKGAQESCQLIKDLFLQAQEQSVPAVRELSRCVGRQTWLNIELVNEQKNMCTGDGSKDKLLKRNIDILLQHAGMVLGKPKLK